MLYKAVPLALLILVGCTTVSVRLPTVQTSLGPVEGKFLNSTRGNRIFAFEGIPYARPPVGKLRFKDPILYAKPWQGTWVARSSHACLQFLQYKKPDQDPLFGTEDCLYLNVYTRNLSVETNQDVIVYIHGGAFMFGHGSGYGPEYLLENNIILVTINYRLGPLGFLSTEDSHIPGNFGFKDQIVALQWIQRHIQSFGGNKNSVTISGTSAGGASVHLHYLTAKSAGLFHRGISQSGTALNPWVIMENARNKSHTVGSLVGCPSNRGSKKLLECLLQRPAADIVRTVPKFQSWLYNPFSPFGVVVDWWAADPVLPIHPMQALIEKKVAQDLPWMCTITEAEGLYPGAQYYNADLLKQLDVQWRAIAPHLLDFNYTAPYDQHDTISDKIRLEYFGKMTHLSRDNFDDLIRMIGDRMFKSDMYKATRLHSSQVMANVFSYRFLYRGKFSTSDEVSGTTINMGASHMDDIAYILKSLMNTLSTPSDALVTNKMVGIFSSFASTGQPKVKGIDWKPVSKNISDPLIYLQISTPKETQINAKFDVGNEEFWTSLNFAENEHILQH